MTPRLRTTCSLRRPGRCTTPWAEYFGLLLQTLEYTNEVQYGPYVSMGDTYSPEAGISCTEMAYVYSGALVWTHSGERGVDAF